MSPVIRRLRNFIVIVFIWTLLILGGVELALRAVADSLPPMLQIGARFVRDGEAFRATTIDYMTTDDEHGFMLLPGLGNVLHPVGTRNSFTFSTISLWESRMGFRTRPVDYLVETMVVGDSFSFCFTAAEECWVRQYEHDTGLGTVNLAQPATGSVSHLNMLKDFAVPLEPRLVIWQFFGNDFNEDYGAAVQRKDIDAPKNAGDLDVPPLPPVAPVVNWLRHNSVTFASLDILNGNVYPYLTDYARLFYGRHQVTYGDHTLEFGSSYEVQAMDMDDPRNQTGLALSREAFADAQALVNGWDGALLVVLTPTREQVYRHLSEPVMDAEHLAQHDEAYNAMLEICEDLDLLCFDPLPQLQVYAQQNTPLYYRDDMHLNATGNTIFSELVWRWIGGLGLLYE